MYLDSHLNRDALAFLRYLIGACNLKDDCVVLVGKNYEPNDKHQHNHYLRQLSDTFQLGHAAMQGGARAGQTAVVLGAGCIGLVTMMALKAMGVSKVYVVDIMEKRLEKAMELGADGVINGKEKDAVEEVRRLTDGKGCDLAIETAGTQLTTVQTIHMTKKGATIVLVGYSKSGEMTLPMSLALDK